MTLSMLVNSAVINMVGVIFKFDRGNKRFAPGPISSIYVLQDKNTALKATVANQ